MEVDTERELSSAEQVIYGISQMILEGKLKIGDKLPPERDMIDLFKVGRPAVREGLCALQIAGLIDAKHGSGNYITSNISSSILMPLTLGLTLEGVSNNELIQMRICLESFAIDRFYEKMTEEDICNLRGINEKMENAESVEEFSAKDVEFHEYFVKHTDNSLLIYIHKTINHLIRQLIGIAVATADDMNNEDSLENIVSEHQLIVDALAEGKPFLASNRVKSHLENIKL